MNFRVTIYFTLYFFPLPSAGSSFDSCRVADSSGTCSDSSDSSALLQSHVKVEALHSSDANGHTERLGAARVGSGFSLYAEPSVAEQSPSNRCGSHKPPMRAPEVCVYLFTALEDEAYRNRTLIAAKTWASHTALDHAGSFTMRFFVDPKHKHFVDSVLTDSQFFDYEEAHAKKTGTVPYAHLKALNISLQSQTCDWIVLPEDDTYMNVPLLADKLSCLDSAGPPRMLGGLHTSSNLKLDSAKTSNEFVHGSSNIINAAAVPVLWQVAERRHLNARDGYGDVAVAQILLEEYGTEREQAFPFQEFACTHMNNKEDVIEEISKHPEPECLDWFHKVLPETMIKLHEIVSGHPCQRSLADLMERCVAKNKE